MSRFHLIMPMGGRGSRFAECGFDLPKPLIPIYGKPFMYWAVRSITKFNEISDLTFVVLQEHIDRYDLDDKIKVLFPNARIVILNHVLNGPVLTCLAGIKCIDDDKPILFNDCDHLFKSADFNRACASGEIERIDGALITFESNLPLYGYVRYENGRIIGTAEKRVVSKKAICGAYLFKCANQFSELAKSYLSSCEYSEFFISGMYNEMAKSSDNIKAFSTDYHVPFGVPEEYIAAQNDTHFKELE